jgi:hypothetical protein
MDYTDIIAKELRVDFWERLGRIPSAWEIDWEMALRDSEMAS